jgi:uncharacterized protein
MGEQLIYTSFGNQQLIANGATAEILPKIKSWCDAHPGTVLLTFEDHTGRQIDFDLRGTPDEVLERHLPTQPSPPAGPGRPKLGVISREVTLLPRHWEWLEQQPSGASAAIRLLVDQARRLQGPGDSTRAAMDTTCRFLSAMAGDMEGYEEAARALYARDKAKFGELISSWPEDIRLYALKLSGAAFPESE